jgi:hypothetical protein
VCRSGSLAVESSIPVHISIVMPHSFFKEKDYLKEINSGRKVFSKMKFQVRTTLQTIFPLYTPKQDLSKPNC